MVSFSAIKTANSGLDQITIPKVSVFVGGTSGIGLYTIEALVKTSLSLKIYILGRSSAEDRVKDFIQQMSILNSKAELIWMQAEVSLLADVKRVCKDIQAREPNLDLLFMSAGYAPFGARKETSEGIEVAGSLEYYSRILFALHLAPLLSKTNGRVVSVLAGGKESSSIDLDDLGLKDPANFSGWRAQLLYVTMTTVTMERLAHQNPNITWINSFPGWVKTGNMHRGPDPGSATAWFFRFLEPVITPFCISREESGQRYLFQSTSSAFGGKGSAWDGAQFENTSCRQGPGLFLVNEKCGDATNFKVLEELRKTGQDRIQKHTEEILGPYQ